MNKKHYTEVFALTGDSLRDWANLVGLDWYHVSVRDDARDVLLERAHQQGLQVGVLEEDADGLEIVRAGTWSDLSVEPDECVALLTAEQFASLPWEIVGEPGEVSRG